MEKKIEQNKIILAGVVVKMSKTPKVTKLLLSTSPSRTKKYRSYPEVVCFESLSEQLKDVNPKDHVEIECALLTVPYSQRSSINDQSYLVASSVKKSNSKLSQQLGLQNINGVYDDKNEGVIAGVVINVHVMPNDKGVLVSVNAKANGRTSLPSVACFDELAKQIKREQIKKGDTVAMSCFINTGKDNKGLYHESLVAREFSLIERK